MSGADFAADERLLRAIIESPAGQAAVAEGHAKAAAHRATALKVMQAAIVVQAQVQATVATKLGAAREAVDKAHRVWREKLAALHALDMEMATASHLIEAAERGARRALVSDLERIRATVRELAFARLSALASSNYRDTRDVYGNLTGAVDRNPSAGHRAERMRALAAELEALELAEVTPLVIANRCDAALAEMKQLAPEVEVKGEKLIVPPMGLTLL